MITKTSDNRYSATYTCYLTGKPYQALAGDGYYSNVEDAVAAVVAAELRQAEIIAAVDHLTYEAAKNGKVGDTWYHPVYWGELKIAQIVHIGETYILSAEGKNVFLSQGAGDWQYVFTSDNALHDAIAWARAFEAPAVVSKTCHYCGQRAVGFGAFDEPICEGCK